MSKDKRVATDEAQVESLAAAEQAGKLPDADRRAYMPVDAPAIIPNTPAGDVAFADVHAPVAAAHLAAFKAPPAPADTRTIEQVHAGIPRPTDELERLLGLIENETGYAQKAAVKDLRALLGRPVTHHRVVHRTHSAPVEPVVPVVEVVTTS